METWKEVRRAVLTNELSRRGACLEYGLGWHTLQKMLTHAEPPGYRQRQPRVKRKLGAYLPIIEQILEADREAPKKQRHTNRRIFERLRDEHGYRGGMTMVSVAVRKWRQTRKEVFLPLSHPPGEAQVDYGEAKIRLSGQEISVALFVMTLPYSGAIFVQAFPRECTETFLESHRRAFESFGGVPTRIRSDNLAIAVIEVLDGRERKLTQEFLRLQSHYLFREHFCLVRRADEKGHVERLHGYWDLRDAAFWCQCRKWIRWRRSTGSCWNVAVRTWRNAHAASPPASENCWWKIKRRFCRFRSSHLSRDGSSPARRTRNRWCGSTRMITRCRCSTRIGSWSS